MTQPILLLNAVGLTPRLLMHAPRLAAIAAQGWLLPTRDVLPSVTMTAQATLLTGRMPNQHGIVANGWLFRETNEIRFWQQSNRLLQAEPLYETAARVAKQRGRDFKCAKLFWWFNQGANVNYSVTPKPHYGIDGNKVFGITGNPEGYTTTLERQLGKFPFFTFWGPNAGLPCTKWIARCAAHVLHNERPDLTMVYLPHLDYDPQRFGVSGCDMPALVKELDDACAPLLKEAEKLGARVWIVSEYGHCDVDTPVYLNRVLRTANLLSVRRGPFGEQLEPYLSRAFAVCDHQLAHVYVREARDIPTVRDLIASTPGVAKVYTGEERATLHLDHPRSGEIVALSAPNAWFAYPFWLEEAFAPDYARAVAIHHKPGYDPCELFVDPQLRFPKLRIARKILQKKLGLRMVLDVVPLDASLVRGSHGLVAAAPQDGPLCVGTGARPTDDLLPMTRVRDLLLQALDLLPDGE